jgi:hypothetical protein
MVGKLVYVSSSAFFSSSYNMQNTIKCIPLLVLPTVTNPSLLCVSAIETLSPPRPNAQELFNFRRLRVRFCVKILMQFQPQAQTIEIYNWRKLTTSADVFV